MKIEQKDPQALKRHPLRAQIPEPFQRDEKGRPLAVPENDPWGAFVENFRDAGPKACPPLIVTTAGKVINGWRRVLMARALQWETVPCQIVPEEDAVIWLMHGWFGERQMADGTKTRFLVKFFPDYVESGLNKKLANLKNVSKAQCLSKSRTGNSMYGIFDQLEGIEQGLLDTFSTLRVSLGVGRNSFYTGLALARMLDDPKSPELIAVMKAGGHDTDPADIVKLQAELRAEFDPKLERGEMSVWNVRSAIGSRLVTEGNEKPVKQAADLKWWQGHLQPMITEARNWRKLPKEVRQRVKSDIRTLVGHMDPEEQAELLRALEGLE